MGDCVDRELVERLIEAALDRTSYDWTFDCELEDLKFMDLVAEVRGEPVYKPGEPRLTKYHFRVGSLIKLTADYGYLYSHPGVENGDVFEIVEYVHGGGRYDQLLVKKVGSDGSKLYEFLVIDQDCYELVG